MLMDTPRSSTPVAEFGASESMQQTFSPQLHASSTAVRSPTTAGGIQRTKTSLREHAAILMQPPKKVGPTPTVWKSVRAIILSSYFNILLICIPIAWALNFALPDKYALVFVFSFLAIVPLAKLLAFATDELSMRVGQTLAGLLNATLGNAVELIVSIIALAKCELTIVQSSLIGSIIGNLLLVLGMCFFAGGLKYKEQGFGTIAAQMNSSLLTISVIAVLLPSAFFLSLESSSSVDTNLIDQSILKMSHGVAIILLFIYASYLFFQLSSHKSLYQDDCDDVMKSIRYNENPFKFKRFRHHRKVPRVTEVPMVTSPLSSPPQVTFSPPMAGASDTPQPVPDAEAAFVPPLALDDETEEPQMSVIVSFALLVVVTVLVAVTAEFLVGSINGLTESGAISKEFIGVILLPIVGNAAEHVTAVVVSVEDKLTLSLGVAVGSSIQIALFVIPFIVTLGWMMGKPLTLLFDPLQSVVLFLTVIIVNSVIQDGKSNWLEGMILMCLYLILCVTFWYYPGTNPVISC